MGPFTEYNQRYITGMQEALHQYMMRYRDCNGNEQERQRLQRGILSLQAALNDFRAADQMADERYA